MAVILVVEDNAMIKMDLAEAGYRVLGPATRNAPAGAGPRRQGRLVLSA